MIIIPTIELQNRRCVSLRRGRLDEPVIWHVDPVERACDFADAGAQRLQVTDFDAITGDEDNRDIVIEIMRRTGVDVQVAGGIRTLERAREWLDAGAARVVIGTAAVANPEMVRHAAKYHPDAVILAVDVFQGRVMSQGWREPTAFAPADFIAHFAASPLAALQITDIDADVGDSDATLSLIADLAAHARTPVIASGMVRGLDDIARLKYAGHVEGVIVGRALFNHAIEIEDALRVAAEPAEPAPGFI